MTNTFPALSPILAALHGGLIVSCQALPHEPLFGSAIMARLAIAAREGGAVGIRANTPDDVRAIRAAISADLPLIGLWKVVLPGWEDVYITPRVQEAVAVADAGADIIALDATLRPHPEGTTADFIRAVKRHGKLVMADIDNETAAVAAVEAGADIISTTLSGYTSDSPALSGPDLALVRRLAALNLPVPFVAEGRIHSPEDARAALDAGAFAVVVGGAITRPQQIARRFAEALMRS